ncbi:MAG: phytoene desaturase family protein [Ktedonobacterales bacterium]
MTTANLEHEANQAREQAQREMPARRLDYDVVVIGAGLGGLLSAAQFLRRGRRVMVVERLAHPGGRFTAKLFQGAQVSTGAVHMLPFGTNGELAAMLRGLGVPHAIHDSEVFASFHVRGKQIVARSVLQLAGVLGARQFAQFVQLGYAMLLRGPRPDERAQTYRQWLDQRISRAGSPQLYAYFERVCHFALSVDLDDVLYPEIVETTRNMFRYGAPGIVEGGCAALTGELERRVTTSGGEVLLEHETLAIIQQDGKATGALVRDKRSGEVTQLCAPLIISNIGPNATARLLADASSAPDQPDGAPAPKREASGLKTHLLADESIIPHRGIMYCLDTKRIAGIVQPSNSDRRLAPPGKHLLITHQLMYSDDVNAERESARADLRYLFGDDFGEKVRILTMSQYRGEWPVNRMAQGSDVSPRTRLPGLYLVGDAVKPSGYLMVEGVAQSVNALLDTLDGWDAADALQPAAQALPNTPAKPSKRRAFHWLLAPPPPNRGSQRAPDGRP